VNPEFNDQQHTFWVEKCTHLRDQTKLSRKSCQKILLVDANGPLADYEILK